MTAAPQATTAAEPCLPPCHEPGDVLGLARLARLSFDGLDLTPAWHELARRAAEPDGDAALMDLCILSQIMGRPEQGLALQAEALKSRRLYRLAPYQTEGGCPRLRVLGFAAPGDIGANIPMEFLVEDGSVELHYLYVVPGQPLPPVPEHDLAIVLAGESEKSRAVLWEIERLAASWPRPVIDQPQRVPRVGRERLYRLLEGVPGIAIPATVRVMRETLARIGAGESGAMAVLPDGGFPLIARPFDCHAGLGLVRLAAPADVAPYLAERPEQEFYVSHFIDSRRSDGLYRKARIAMIDGEPFPCHLAISESWMVHYVSAGMERSAAKRVEEARFMTRFAEEFGQRHGPAIAEISRRLELEYFGLDCWETADGRLLLFEADTGMVVHDMDSPNLYPYKRPQMRRVFTAFQAMLERAASRPSHLHTPLEGCEGVKVVG